MAVGSDETTIGLPRRARASLYRLFADLLTCELDHARLEALRPFGGTLALAEPELPAWLDRAGELELGALRAEFARLFLLPGGVPPRASAWLEGDQELHAQQIATLAHRATQALELDQTRVAGHLMLDHLGLLYAIADAGLASEVPERVRIGEHVERHALGPWVDEFARALARRTDAPVYRALARMIEATGPATRPGSDL